MTHARGLYANLGLKFCLAMGFGRCVGRAFLHLHLIVVTGGELAFNLGFGLVSVGLSV